MTRLPPARHEGGFTLVELLVVIGIIAILTAIAVPMFLSQRQKANAAALRSDMNNVVNAMETWYVDNPNGTIIGDVDRGRWSIVLTSQGVRFGSYSASALPDGFDSVPLSDGTAIGVIARPREGAGNFCVLGSNKQSKDYQGGPYKNFLYYDSARGGILNSNELSPTGTCSPYYYEIENGN